MTLTELRYAIAVARLLHFGKAAQSCNVSQPSLSVAVKKLEEELGVQLFERRSADVTLTPIGELVIEQAQRVLEETERIRELAQQGKDPLSAPLRLGAIFTIAPYLFPSLVRQMRASCPTMPLILSENYTATLLDNLKSGLIDCAVMALPIAQTGLNTELLYDEDFIAAVPAGHALAQKKTVGRGDFAGERMMLLGQGNCFRDEILEFFGEALSSDRTAEGSSLQTISHMVAQGIGTTLLPGSALPYFQNDPLLRLIPFEKPDIPKRRVVLVWRKSFPRKEAISALTDSIGKLVQPHCNSLIGREAVPIKFVCSN